MIYQFAKTVKAITDTPGEPVNDFIDLASFLYLIEAKELDTSHINGFDHKEKFEETLIKAQNLLAKLETNKEVQKYIREQEAARREQERQQEAARQEKARLREKEAAKERKLAGTTQIYVTLFFVALTFGVVTTQFETTPLVIRGIPLVVIIYAFYRLCRMR